MRARYATMPVSIRSYRRCPASQRALRAIVNSAVRRYETASLEGPGLESIDFQTEMNLLKVNASETAIATVMCALRACGLAGYRNDSEFSVGRHLRDILSSPIMINNDRILANAASASLLSEVAPLLRD